MSADVFVKKDFTTIIHEILHQLSGLNLDDSSEHVDEHLEQSVCSAFFEKYLERVNDSTVDIDSIRAHITSFKKHSNSAKKNLRKIGLNDTTMFNHAQYDAKMYKTMSRTNSYKFMALFAQGLEPILKTQHKIMYQYDPQSKEFSQLIEVPEHEIISMDITYYGDKVILQYVNRHVFLEYFFSRNDERYVFIPVSLSMISAKSGHMTMLILDNWMRTFYYFDPNGATGYFRSENPNTESYIHETLCRYINQELGLDHSFIPFPDSPSINSSDGTSYTYDKGHCVAASFMMVHLLKELPIMTPDMILNHIETMPRQEQRQLIYNFTANMCKFAKIKPIEDDDNT